MDKYSISFDLDGVPYSVDWNGSSSPDQTVVNSLVGRIKASKEHRNAALTFNAPKIPSGIKAEDVSAYRKRYFDDPNAEQSIPNQTLQKIVNLPRDQREAAIPQGWSALGKVALLQAAYHLNPAMPISSEYAVQKSLNSIGATEQQVRELGTTGAIAKNEKVRRDLLNEREELTSGSVSFGSGQGATMPYVSTRSIFTSDKKKQAENQKRLAEVDKQLNGMGLKQEPPRLLPVGGLGTGALNKGVSALLSGKSLKDANPSTIGTIVDYLAGQEGTYQTAQTTPDFMSHLATGLTSFLEPESLAIMSALSPVANATGKVGHAANLAVFGLPVANEAVKQFQEGNYGAGLGDLTAFALPFIHSKVEQTRYNNTLKRVASGEIEMPVKIASQIEKSLNLEKGHLKANPDIAKQIAVELTTKPVKEPKQPKQQAAEPILRTSNQVVDPAQVGVDPELQYKKTGIVDPVNQVTDALKGTKTYDVDQGGTWTVFKNENGELTAVNSHHRRELANRAERFVKVDSDGNLVDVPREVPIRVLDVADGWTKDKARGYGALENIRDGKGTAIDALDVMDTLKIGKDEFDKYGISTTGELARNITNLQNLPPDAITRIKMGDVNEKTASGIGSVEELNEGAQMAALDEATHRGYAYDKARDLANEYLQDQKSGLLAQEQATNQTSMFDEELTPTVKSTRGIRLELKDAVNRAVTNEYKELLKPTSATLKEGEKIDVEQRKAEAAQLAENTKALKERLDLLFNNDAVREQVNQLAAEVGNGKLKKQDAINKLTELAKSNVGKSISDLVDPSRVGTSETSPVPDSNAGTKESNGLFDEEVKQPENLVRHFVQGKREIKVVEDNGQFTVRDTFDSQTVYEKTHKYKKSAYADSKSRQSTPVDQAALLVTDNGKAKPGQSSAVVNNSTATQPSQPVQAAQTQPTATTNKPHTLGQQMKEKTLSSTPETLRPVIKKVFQFFDEIRDLFNPADSYDQEFAPKTARIFRERAAQKAQEYERAVESLKEAKKAFDKMSEDERLTFIDAIETGSQISDPDLQKFASLMKEALDSRVQEVQKLGKGQLENLIQNYFPHIWKDPKEAVDHYAVFYGKRPFEGSKGFTKQRSIPTTREGIDQGLIPVSSNPVELTLLKIYEMDRFIMAHKVLNEMKETKIGIDENGKDTHLVKFVRATEKAPAGYTALDDRIAQVFGGSSVEIKEAFDQGVWDGINKVIEELRKDAPLTDTRKAKIGVDAWGYAKGGEEITTKTGGDLSIKIHELGHVLDERFKLWDWFQKRDGSVRVRGVKGARKVIAEELRALADLRYEGQNVSQNYKSYVRNRQEKIANAITAYIYAPEKMAEVAPTVKKRFDQFLVANPELSGLARIKPSLTLGTRSEQMNVGGLIIRGRYYAPQEVSKIFNNYLSPGLRGQAWYDIINRSGNLLNQAQLGLSAFHLMFTSVDAITSKTALAVEQIASGKVVDAGKSLVSAPVAPVSNILRGNQLYKAYLDPEFLKSRPELANLVDALIASGGRIKMDSHYQSGVIEGMKERFREAKEATKNKQFGKAALSGTGGLLSVPFAAVELAAKPLMEYIVPRQKLGVFADLARFELERLPKNATRDDVRRVMAEVWDSVDNRMGQLVYDNLFWQKYLKDTLMITTRSVGWNLGTIREIGGGFVDLTHNVPAKAAVKMREITKTTNQIDPELLASIKNKPLISHRTAYLVALPVTVAAIGGITHYLMTGKRPEELKDYFFPRTGRTLPDGKPERVQIASYMKDVFAYHDHPLTTLSHKTHPLISMSFDMLYNEDFYGNEIKNEDDPLVKQVQEEAKYLATQFVPFSMRQNKANKSDARMKALAFVGITSAPADVDRTEAEKMLMKYYVKRLPQGARKQEEVEASDRRRDIKENVMSGKMDEAKQAAQEAVKSGTLTNKQALAAMRAGKKPQAESMYKLLTADEALKVYLVADDKEKRVFRSILFSKLSSYAAQHGRDSDLIKQARENKIIKGSAR